ncbi:uncharacterized protein L201_001888 [Kwoniella dendrophila CBS 6074]|uniref:Uncharacterized protein n=1 Tax=Kwoniella dendrophila CBS 6074 TaxID=1295534 RepID=A0AAX4JPK1_9TREE
MRNEKRFPRSSTMPLAPLDLNPPLKQETSRLWSSIIYYQERQTFAYFCPAYRKTLQLWKKSASNETG